jgi:hypothetical protein
MSYIVCEEPKKNGVEMTARKNPLLPVERPLKERKSRIEKGFRSSEGLFFNLH